MEQNNKLEGVIERLTYHNPETGYMVVRFRPTSTMSLWSGVDEQGLMTIVGIFPEVSPGESLEVEGNWQTHPSYGKQFRVASVRKIAPATVEGLRRYLGSGLIKGVGPKTAERIVNHFGLDTLEMLDHDPERLFEVAGVGAHRVRLITRAWAEQQQIKHVMLFLQSHGVSTSLAVKIYKTYGDESIKQVEEDPYQLTRDVFGIGFKTADQIAKNLGLAHEHPKRIQSGLAYALNQASEEGHVFLPETELVEKASELLDVPMPDVQASVERAAQEELITFSELPQMDSDDETFSTRAIYLPPFYHAEIGCVRTLHNIYENPRSFLEKDQVDRWALAVTDAEKQGGASLSQQQKDAILTALTNKVSILTGGPGTGKTTALRTLIYALQASEHSFLLASPTGRAAKRLSEATGKPASTIHRMLGYSPAQGFFHNEENPLIADFVIIDECSMIDIFLAYSLFRALDSRAHLLLVGDVDQLPSVGPGDVLRELIRSEEVPVTRLEVIFRQAEDSHIIANAHHINQGRIPVFPEDSQDFFLFNIADDPERASDLIVDIVQNRVPQRFGFHPVDDIQILVPMYRGKVGVSALNQALQQALNPPGRLAERHLGGRTFRVGDKVLQTRNNYEKDVFNGDVGRIKAIDFVNQEIQITFDERTIPYDWAEAQELMHAFAISVHRSQGSEYPVIVMPVVTQHYMLLQRNLLYTAITRAKNLVVLVGSTKAIAIAVNNNRVSQRYTSLSERLRGEL